MSTDAKPRVLFPVYRELMSQPDRRGWLRDLAGERFESLSAGVEPQGLNPRAVATMREVGIDISAQRSQNITEFLADPPDLVVTVCDHAAESCPTFPGATQIVHWPFLIPRTRRAPTRRSPRNSLKCATRFERASTTG